MGECRLDIVSQLDIFGAPVFSRRFIVLDAEVIRHQSDSGLCESVSSMMCIDAAGSAWCIRRICGCVSSMSCEDAAHGVEVVG